MVFFFRFVLLKFFLIVCLFTKLRAWVLSLFCDTTQSIVRRDSAGYFAFVRLLFIRISTYPSLLLLHKEARSMIEA